MQVNGIHGQTARQIVKLLALNIELDLNQMAKIIAMKDNYLNKNLATLHAIVPLAIGQIGYHVQKSVVQVKRRGQENYYQQTKLVTNYWRKLSHVISNVAQSMVNGLLGVNGHHVQFHAMLVNVEEFENVIHQNQIVMVLHVLDKIPILKFVILILVRKNVLEGKNLSIAVMLVI